MGFLGGALILQMRVREAFLGLEPFLGVGREPGPLGTLVQRAGGGCMLGQGVWGPGEGNVPLIPVVRVRRGIFGENGVIVPRSLELWSWGPKTLKLPTARSSHGPAPERSSFPFGNIIAREG